VLALAIEVQIARGGAAAGLDVYEHWLGDRKVDDPYAVRRIARAVVLPIADGTDPRALDAMNALAEDGDASARAELTRRMYAGTGDLAAAKALAPIDDGAVRFLIQALKTTTGSKVGVIDALVASHSKLAVEPLADLLSDTAHPDHVLAAVDGLGRLGARSAIPRLQSLAKSASTSSEIRWAASAALYKLGDFTGRDLLEGAAKSDQPARRLAAVDAMSSRPDAAWQSVVRALTKDANATIRIQSAKLIAPYDAALARAVLETELATTNAATRAFAAQTFAQSVAADIPALRKLLRSTDTVARIFAAVHILELTR
jgi:HEAT repeat protein